MRWHTLLLLGCVSLALCECEPEHEPDEEHEEAMTRNTVVLLVTALIFVTIVFEVVKDKIEELAVGPLEPIIAALWAELTVLGFVGLLAFILNKTKALDHVSVSVFGEEEEDRVTESLEDIHMLLFLIMVIFIIEAVCLVVIAKKVGQLWRQMEQEVADKEKLTERYISTVRSGTVLGNLSGLSPANQDEWIVEVFEYKAMRDNFLHPTSLDPDVESKARLSPDFDFAEYLSLCAGKELGEIVEVGHHTWFLFLVICVIFWAIFRLNFWVRLGCFLFVAYAQLVVVFVTRAKLLRIRHNLLPHLPHHATKENVSRHGRSVNVNVEAGEAHALVASEDGGAVPKYHRTAKPAARSRLASWLFGSPVPNKHETLFWLAVPRTTFFVVQAILLLNAVYIAVLGDYFAPTLLTSDEVSVAVKVVLMVAAVAPLPVALLKFVPVLVWRHIEVSNVEMMRKRRVEAEVQRTMKTRKSIRAIKMIAVMNYKAQAQAQTSHNINERGALTTLEKQELRDLFDLFDADKGGSIDIHELDSMFKQIHQNVSKDELEVMVRNVDSDGSGDLDFEEFCNLMASRVRGKIGFEDSAKLIFSTFDKDGSGSITHEEFRETMRQLDSTFSKQDIDAIIGEMDKDGDGMIDAEEFSELLKKHLEE